MSVVMDFIKGVFWLAVYLVGATLAIIIAGDIIHGIESAFTPKPQIVYVPVGPGADPLACYGPDGHDYCTR